MAEFGKEEVNVGDIVKIVPIQTGYRTITNSISTGVLFRILSIEGEYAVIRALGLTEKPQVVEKDRLTRVSTYTTGTEEVLDVDDIVKIVPIQTGYRTLKNCILYRILSIEGQFAVIRMLGLTEKPQVIEKDRLTKVNDTYFNLDCNTDNELRKIWKLVNSISAENREMKVDLDYLKLAIKNPYQPEMTEDEFLRQDLEKHNRVLIDLKLAVWGPVLDDFFNGVISDVIKVSYDIASQGYMDYGVLGKTNVHYKIWMYPYTLRGRNYLIGITRDGRLVVAKEDKC